MGASALAHIGQFGSRVLPDGGFDVESGGPMLTWVFQSAGLAGPVTDAISVAGTQVLIDQNERPHPSMFDAIRQRLAVGDVVRHVVTVIDIDPQIALSGAGRAIAHGAIDVDAGALTRTFVISNTGKGRLDVTSFTVDNAAFTIANLVSASVTADGSLSFMVAFDPAQASVFDATVAIRSNDADEGAYRIALRGSGQGGASALNRRVYVPLTA